MKHFLWVAFSFFTLSTQAQPTSQSFYQQHKAELLRQFGSLVSEGDLQHLLYFVIDRHHLEVEENHYFRAEPAPLTILLQKRVPGHARSQLRDAVVYPLVRYTLPRILPPPVVTQKHPLGDRVAARAFAYLGIRYGSPTFNRQTGRGTLDCSGLVRYVLADIKLPYQPGAGGHSVAGFVDSPDFKVVTGPPRRGDLLVRQHGGRWAHAGIYVGNGQLIDAPYSGSVVRLTAYRPERWGVIRRYSRRE